MSDAEDFERKADANKKLAWTIKTRPFTSPQKLEILPPFIPLLSSQQHRIPHPYPHEIRVNRFHCKAAPTLLLKQPNLFVVHPYVHIIHPFPSFLSRIAEPNLPPANNAKL